MADIASSIATAKKAGYSDQEIADYIAKDPSMGGKVAEARKQGYSDAEIVGHLGKRPGVVQQVIGATVDAVNKLKSDAVADYRASDARFRAPAPRGIVENIKLDVADDRRKLGILADVAAVPMAPIGAATDALVVSPAARALAKIPGTDEQGWTDILHKGLMGLGAEVGIAGRAAGASSAARAAAVPKPNALTEAVRAFDRAGVNPSLAAVKGEGGASVAKAVAENPVAGVRARAALNRSIAQTGEAADRIAQGYGAPRGAQIAGENVKSGVRDFARSDSNPTSFKGRSQTLYDRAFAGLDEAMAGKTEPPQTQPVFGTGMLSGTQMGTLKAGGSSIRAPETTRVLNEIGSGVQSKPIADLVSDPTLKRAASALEQGQAQKDMSFSDLRRLRTWVRDAQKNDELRQSIGSANLQRLESSLTSDIYTNAEKLASPALAHQLRRADQFYRTGSERIERALKPFDSAGSGESAFNRVIQAAGSGSTADAQKLLSLKRSLSPEEWNDVAATAVKNLGKPSKGAANAIEGDGFSINNFVSNYAALSPRGRDILFGSIGGGGSKATGLRSELDNLARVAQMQKNVERAANGSKSAVSAQTVGTAVGLLTPHTALPTAGILSGLAVTGEMMTNPNVVRWLARIGTAERAASSPQAVRVVVKQLQSAARRNAVLVPISQQATRLIEIPQVATKSAATEQQQ